MQEIHIKSTDTHTHKHAHTRTARQTPPAPAPSHASDLSFVASPGGFEARLFGPGFPQTLWKERGAISVGRPLQVCVKRWGG